MPPQLLLRAMTQPPVHRRSWRTRTGGGSGQHHDPPCPDTSTAHRRAAYPAGVDQHAPEADRIDLADPVASPETVVPVGVDLDDGEVVALLDAIPATAGHPRIVVDLPGGLTNRNLRVTTPAGTAVVRIPGAGSRLLEIDRDQEHRNSCAAAEAGVGPPVLHYRPGEGLTVGYLPSRTLSDADLHAPAVLERVALACRRLHAGPRFANDFDMFAVQARYRRIVAEQGFRLPDRYDEFAPVVARIRTALGPRRDTVPCHNDLLAENLLAVPDGAGGEDIRIIDYEYAGNNDPCFELGQHLERGNAASRAARRPDHGLLRATSAGPGGPGAAVRAHVAVRVDAVGVDHGRLQRPRLRLLGLGHAEVRARRRGVRWARPRTPAGRGRLAV